MSVCDHMHSDGQCTVAGCKFNPQRTLDELIEFYGDDNFKSGSKISLPYGATRRALEELRELRDMRRQLIGMLDSSNNAVRVCEGGGPEDVSMSVCVTVVKLEGEVQRLRDLIDTPQIHEFVEAVKLEAAHQRERWGVDHDAGKTDADWFWLIGYLAGKALHLSHMPPDAINVNATPPRPFHVKQLHHIITTAAACLNWHMHRIGIDTRMRPGIDPTHDFISKEEFQNQEKQ